MPVLLARVDANRSCLVLEDGGRSCGCAHGGSVVSGLPCALGLWRCSCDGCIGWGPIISTYGFHETHPCCTIGLLARVASTFYAVQVRQYDPHTHAHTYQTLSLIHLEHYSVHSPTTHDAARTLLYDDASRPWAR